MIACKSERCDFAVWIDRSTIRHCDRFCATTDASRRPNARLNCLLPMSRLVHWAVHSLSHDERFAKLQGVNIAVRSFSGCPHNQRGYATPKTRLVKQRPSPLRTVSDFLSSRVCRSVHLWTHALRSKECTWNDKAFTTAAQPANPLTFSEFLIPQMVPLVAMPRRLRHQAKKGDSSNEPYVETPEWFP